MSQLAKNISSVGNGESSIEDDDIDYEGES